MIDRISRLPLRSIWKHEATDFTVWLCDNIDVLDDIINVKLKNQEREQTTGNFYVDIKAEDEDGKTVIIENQLGKSDHDHLGKLITYLAAFGASKAIWIVSEPKEEDITAITWLNEQDNGCDFYILKLEAIKIGDSQPAPLITKIAGPNEDVKQFGRIKQEDSERHTLRKQFWKQLLQISKSKHNLFNSISPTKDNWISTTSGKSGISYYYGITQTNLKVEVHIDKGKNSVKENHIIFNYLLERKEQIEQIFGGKLEWDELEGYRMCAIRVTLNNGGYRNDEKEWYSIAENAVDIMVRLERATKDIIRTMPF